LQASPSEHDVPFATGVAVHPVDALQPSVVHGFPSLQTSGVPAVHVPLWHVSPPLHAFPSEHDVPFATAVFAHTPALHVSVVHGLPSLQSAATAHGWQPAIGEFTQPELVLHESVVHALPSSQLSAVPAVHVPLWHVSAPLQTFASAHDVPFATGVVVQPVDALQPSVVQGLPSLHVSGVPEVQRPLWQVSAPLQALPSEHEVPFVTLVLVQPVPGSQPFVVHGLPSSHVRGVPAVHVPLWQVSPPLHRLPSLHDDPFATGVFWQPVPGSQLSLVHTLPSLQFGAVPAVHVPLWQVSAPLQAFPSEHDVPFVTGAVVQPVPGSQPSVVHGLPSLQTSGVPAVHVPLWHVSAPLHVFPSEHDVPFATAGFSHRFVPVLHTSAVHGFPSTHSLSSVQVVWPRAIPGSRKTAASNSSHVPRTRGRQTGSANVRAGFIVPP
jgi:hypothetical protein